MTTKKTPTTIGWLGHILTFLSLVIFLVGCVIIGYVAWVLSTSVSIQKFQSGTLILTYIVIGIGFTLFFTGLVGWVAGASETACIIRLFIVMVALSLTTAIGGILALQIMHIGLEDILRYAWIESNQSIRNLIQTSLHCCGFRGPIEFAGNNYHMDSSCYEFYHGERRLKHASCSSQLAFWLDMNKSIWISVLVAFLSIELLSVVVAAFGLHSLAKKKRKSKSSRNESRSSSNRHLYSGGSDGTSETFRDSL